MAEMAELEALLADGPEQWEPIVVAEATVRRHPTLTAPWCLLEEVPEVPTGDDHTQGHVYGAVAPLTGRVTGRGGIEVGSRTATVATLHDGRLVRLTMYNLAEALEAVGPED